MTKKNEEKRRHPRLPMLSNLVQPVNLVYKTEEGKELSVLGVLSDLSASGMRLIVFLEAPFSNNITLTLDLPTIGKVDIKGRTTWMKQKETVFTLGIEFTEIPEPQARKISALAADYADCDTRILLRLPEVCVPTCKANALCNKIQKDETFFK